MANVFASKSEVVVETTRQKPLKLTKKAYSMDDARSYELRALLPAKEQEADNVGNLTFHFAILSLLRSQSPSMRTFGLTSVTKKILTNVVVFYYL